MSGFYSTGTTYSLSSLTTREYTDDPGIPKEYKALVVLVYLELSGSSLLGIKRF